ncbi:MAG: hypothetical protein HC836_24720 [Richelia sp. RM2_1_2]|nr:hypothetical protein [Richelia sp. RM2_1_2]
MKLDIYGKEVCNQCLTVGDFNEQFGFYKCPKCGYTWAYDEDDPDYDEPTLELCPFHKNGSCSNNMPTYPRCSECPNNNLN